MSSLSVCQGLQLCLEPLIMEPHILRFKLTPHKYKFSRSISPSSKSQSHTEENTTTTNIKINNNKHDDGEMKTEDTGGWSFLQCLTNTKETADDNKKVYVPPLVKRSSSTLSEKSLEMCTESLGSETGSLVSENSDDIITTTTTISSSPTQLIRETNLMTKLRTSRNVSFPPLLTSISGVQVRLRPLREDGRLVLQAATVSSSRTTYFHAERCDGRLRLCLVKDLDHSSNEDEEELDEEVYDDEYKDEEEFEKEVYEDEYEEEDEFSCDEGEDVEGENGKVEGEIGIEKLPRPSRCKESGRGAGLWVREPFWVAT